MKDGNLLDMQFIINQRVFKRWVWTTLGILTIFGFILAAYTIYLRRKVNTQENEYRAMQKNCSKNQAIVTDTKENNDLIAFSKKITRRLEQPIIPTVFMNIFVKEIKQGESLVSFALAKTDYTLEVVLTNTERMSQFLKTLLTIPGCSDVFLSSFKVRDDKKIIVHYAGKMSKAHKVT